MLRSLPVLLATVLACAGLSGDDCPEPAVELAVPVPSGGVEPTCAEARLGPDALYERAVAELRANRLEMGYRNLALIRILHPERADLEVFTLAARVFRRSYRRHRTEIGSPWVTSEPRFMFDWLADFFDGRDEFPQQPVDAMLLGLDYGMFRRFLAYVDEHADERPHLARWSLSVEKDNGIVESITAVRSDRAAGERAGP